MRGELGWSSTGERAARRTSWAGRSDVSPERARACLPHGGWQMGQDLTTKIERTLTRLGMWGAMQGVLPLAAALIGSVALLEFLAPPVARLLPAVPANVLHVLAVGIGLLLGLGGYFAGEFWDRFVFEAYYGPKGRWLDAARTPLALFPVASELKRQRSQAVQALPRRPDSGEGIYREAVKLARRQVERWERIEHPLILSRFVRALLWPCLSVTLLAFCAAILSPLLGAPAGAPRFLAIAVGCLALALLLLIPYSHLRVEHMIRLYQDVASHAGKRKPERR